MLFVKRGNTLTNISLENLDHIEKMSEKRLFLIFWRNFTLQVEVEGSLAEIFFKLKAIEEKYDIIELEELKEELKGKI